MMLESKKYFNPMLQPSIIERLFFVLKLIIFLILVSPLIIISLFGRGILPLIDKWFPLIFHKLLIWLLSVKIKHEGNKKNSKECNLFVCNHISYLDIPILGSSMPVRFVAKSEVKDWPIFGFLSKLANTVYIKRVKSDTLLQKFFLLDLLSVGEKLLIFPEATTSDGNRVLPFKSSAFSALENQNFIIQPLVIIYTDINGVPINRWLMPVIAWYGDMELNPHLVTLKDIKFITAKIIYLDCINTNDFADRKDLSKYLEKKINYVYSNY